MDKITYQDVFMDKTNTLASPECQEENQESITIFLHEHKITDANGMTAIYRHMSPFKSAEESRIDSLCWNEDDYLEVIKTLCRERFDVLGSTIEHLNTEAILAGGFDCEMSYISEKILNGEILLWSLTFNP